MQEPWYGNSYRRNLVDMHIADWDERFLSEFDPEKYVETVCLSDPTAAMVYAHSHVGHCYYPTEVGHPHASLHGRNVFGEVIDGFHRRGVDVVAYYSLIFDDYASRRNPDWSIIQANGEAHGDHRRYSVCCPNSPYRDYAAAHVEELCSRFRFEGIFLDMTFWPNVCYCPYCQRRFAAEVGGALPRVVDWEDPLWVSFQRKREEWLLAFARHLTHTIRRTAPGVSVQHQGSTYMHGWRFGVTDSLAAANDYLGGDFYGDALQGSVVRKLFHNLSPHLPFEFMTSFSTNLSNHTARKSGELLRAKVSACLADAGAFLFIDAIDPVGTLNPAACQVMRSVFDESKAYERYLGGSLCQDVAIYLSTESKYDPADRGKAVDDPHLSTRLPHIEGVLSVAKTLIENHIPYGVISRANLADLARHRLVVLPNVLVLDPEEADAFRGYVAGGGALYASEDTSLATPDGVRHPDFLLADVFGVSYVGRTQESFTYIAPTDEGEDLFSGYSAHWPLGMDQAQMIVRAAPGARVLGRIVLPYTDPAEHRRFVSIHSNPPGIRTDHPAVVLNHYGRGTALYAAASLERAEIHRDSFANLVRFLAGPFSAQASAPKSVEMTIFHQPENRRTLISLVNFQHELPNIPVRDIRVRVSVGQRGVAKLLLLPGERAWPYEFADGWLEFVAPTLETFQMFALDYGRDG
ncbi:MAG: hypothetical protein V1800_08160 [Candidatus Latescibacterota bacterium]